MAGNPQPLDQQFPIVDAQGRPTIYFIQWAQQRQIDITDGLTLAGLEDYLLAHKFAAGNGIGLAPNGDLASSPTITAKVQEILDQLSSTEGSVLYRGAAGWAALAPDTAGKVLSTNGAGADPTWIAARGAITAPWQDYVCTITSETGAFDTVSVQLAQFQVVDGTCFVQGYFTVSTTGTAGGRIIVSLPAGHFPPSYWPVATGLKASTAQMMVGDFNDVTKTLHFALYDGSSPIAATSYRFEAIFRTT